MIDSEVFTVALSFFILVIFTLAGWGFLAVRDSKREIRYVKQRKNTF